MSAADAETKDEGNQAPIANPTFGTNRFAEKQADLEAYKENDMDVEKFKKMAAEAA